MNVIVIEEVAGEYAALGEMIRKTGHATQVVPSDRGPDAVANEMPDIVVMGARKAHDAIAAYAKALGGCDDGAYRALIAIVDGDTSDARAVANSSGADEVVLSTASPSEIVDHVRSSERIVRLERKLRERVVELEAALRRLSFAAVVRGEGVAAAANVQNKGGIRFLLTHAWTAVDDILRGMCAEYLQRPFNQVGGNVRVPHGCIGASISLTDVENELGLEISFVTTAATAKNVAAMFTGDPSIVDDDVVKDVLLELANSGMGAVRAAFLSEEFRFAASPPKPLAAVSLPKLVERVEAKRVLTFRNGEDVVYVVVAVRSQGRIKLRATNLREGMVVASDITNDAGVLLVRAGTRLTETAASRVAKMVPNKEIELADAA